jgi:acetylornithine aminotransferase
MAKGMGNGFPVGGVLIKNNISLKKGMLGTTFGGNPLACAASIAVLDVIAEEKLIENAKSKGDYLFSKLKETNGIKDLRGQGLMIGIDLYENSQPHRSKLLFDHHIITGSAKTAETIRLLPPLCIEQSECEKFINSFQKVIDQ